MFTHTLFWVWHIHRRWPKVMDTKWKQHIFVLTNKYGRMSL